MTHKTPDDPEIYFAKYEAFVESRRKRLGVRAKAFRWYYNVSRASLVMLGISIPALSAGLFGEHGKSLVPFVALFIALLAALDALLKPGENWQHFRSYQLALERTQRISKSKRIALALETDMQKRYQKQFALYREFVSEIEGLLERETSLFFQHQIQQLREPKDAA